MCEHSAIHRPCAYCEYAGCEICTGDLCYVLDGVLICEDCLTPFVRQWMRPCRRLAGEEGLCCIP